MRYSVAADVVNEYGYENVRAWADLEATGNAITDATIAARIAYQCSAADALIDAHLRCSNLSFLLPLQTVPLLITKISAIIAGYWLYHPRGTRDMDQKGEAVDILTATYKEHLHWLDMIAHDQLKLGIEG